jgi:hypothetical protein
MCNGPGTLETMRILVVLAAVVAAGVIGTTRASATTTADRQAQLSQLRADTVAAQGSLRTRRASLAGAKSGIRAVSQC